MRRPGLVLLAALLAGCSLPYHPPDGFDDAARSAPDNLWLAERSQGALHAMHGTLATKSVFSHDGQTLSSSSVTLETQVVFFERGATTIDARPIAYDGAGPSPLGVLIHVTCTPASIEVWTSGFAALGGTDLHANATNAGTCVRRPGDEALVPPSASSQDGFLVAMAQQSLVPTLEYKRADYVRGQWVPVYSAVYGTVLQEGLQQLQLEVTGDLRDGALYALHATGGLDQEQNGISTHVEAVLALDFSYGAREELPGA